MVWFAPIILTLTFLAFWRAAHLKYVSLKFKYRLYELRDELRTLAINQEVDCDNWLFEYFDRSLSKAISQHYHITLFWLASLGYKYRNDKDLHELSRIITSEFKKVPKIGKIRKEYLEALTEYIEDQHYVTHILVKPVIVVFIGASNAAKKVNDWIRDSLVFPETSASFKVKVC